MANTRYWKSLRERDADAGFLAEAQAEFPETPLQIESGPSRRGFLKAAGFTLAGAVLTGCGEAPVRKALPQIKQPDGFVAGRSYYYASTCGGCSAGCGILAKVRDGRPIKLEGNPQQPISQGALCAVGQASILGLYDSHRLRKPAIQGKPASWDEVDRAIAGRLEKLRADGGSVRFLSDTVASPTERWMIDRFLKGFRDSRHVVYDPLSCSAILDAHEQTHGLRALPRYRFDAAEVIVSFDADFLGTWISPVEFGRQYAQRRRPEGDPPRLSLHVQFESRMSLTGTKADQRIRVAPDETAAVMAQLYLRVAKKAGASRAAAAASETLDQLADALWQARGRSLVVCGSQDLHAQLLCNYLNHLLGNYGGTIDVTEPSYQRQGNDRELDTLLHEIESGKVAALFIRGVNPVYDLPQGQALAAALQRVPLVVSFADRLDETATVAGFVCPAAHYLETWSDAEPVCGLVSLAQPVIQPLDDARPTIEALARWMGAPKPAYDILREYWEARIFPRQTGIRSFQLFWDRSVHDGFARVEPVRTHPKPFEAKPVEAAVAAPRPAASGYSLVLYPKVAMLDGRHSYNPWLQELPDPVTKATWDNYACVAPAMAAQLGLSLGDVIRIDAGDGRVIELPVLIQPGQHDRVIAVPLGYGAKATERFARMGPRWLNWRSSLDDQGLVGRNAAPLIDLRGGALRYNRSGVKIAKTGRRQTLAITQEHHTLTVPEKLAPPDGARRPIIQETTLEAFRKDPSAGAEGHPPTPELWPPDHPFPGHRWGLAVDLNACTGCSACVIACQVENNIPVVGKDEVHRNREMHWIRIDRYYSGPPEDPSVAHQPMMCQQCEHAPCETVCPVLATVHSDEGLNQQIYNRCVGTRYCANNCPYKTRRFNWFDYPRDDRLANMVLNPDVAVRSRGVMEKCSFCVQRIQESKIEARRRGIALSDGDIRTACQQSCPTGAIVFGDMNDPNSKISQLMKSERLYRVLEEINVRPSVGYLRLVRNRPESEGEKRHG